MANVFLATPTRGAVRPEHALFREWLLLTEKRHKITARYVGGYPCSAARNKIQRAFLETDAEWLLMLDDDQVPTSNPLDHIQRDLDMVGFPYPTIRVNNLPDPILWFPCEAVEGGGLVQAEAVGGGCLLIARRVLEAPGMYPGFLDVFNEHGTHYESEDINFCRRVREAGFTIWIDLGHPLLHWKMGEVLELWQTRNAMIAEAANG